MEWAWKCDRAFLNVSRGGGLFHNYNISSTSSTLNVSKLSVATLSVFPNKLEGLKGSYFVLAG